MPLAVADPTVDAKAARMDRRRIEQQLEVISITHRAGARRQDTATMVAFRARALSILAEMAVEVARYPDLAEALARARDEIDRVTPDSPAPIGAYTGSDDPHGGKTV